MATAIVSAIRLRRRPGAGRGDDGGRRGAGRDRLLPSAYPERSRRAFRLRPVALDRLLPLACPERGRRAFCRLPAAFQPPLADASVSSVVADVPAGARRGADRAPALARPTAGG